MRKQTEVLILAIALYESFARYQSPTIWIHWNHLSPGMKKEWVEKAQTELREFYS